MKYDWQSPARAWLDKRAFAEWEAQGRPRPKRGRGRRYCPPDWQRDAIDALNRNDEEAFKAIKLRVMEIGA